MALAYLLDPCQQYQNRAGVNNVAGYFEVFRMDTDDRATVYVDFNGTLAPEHIGIDIDGRAVMIVESGRPYRVEMHAPNGDLLWPVQPVWPVASGGGVSGTDIVSSDGSIAVDKSTVGSFTTYDLSSNVEDSTDLLGWIRCDGATNIDGTDIWKPTYTAGTLMVGDRGVMLSGGQYFHATARVRVMKSAVSGFYDDMQLIFKLFDGETSTGVARQGIVVDGSMSLYQDFEISCDTLPEADCELVLEIAGKEITSLSIQALDMEVHRVFSGAPYIPSGVANKPWVEDNYQEKLTPGQGITIDENNVISSTGGSSYSAGTGIDITDDVISVDTSVIATKSDLAGKQDTISDLSDIRSGAALGATAVQPATLNDYVTNSALATALADYVTDTELDTILEGYATTTALSTGLAGKQDVINDLSDIRSGAALGSTAVQDSNYVHTDNNFTNADVTKLSGIQAGAEVNVQANWNESDSGSDSFILNKPTIPSGAQLVPSATPSDAGEVLTVDQNGTPEWAPAQAPISAGNGVDITNNVVSAKVDGTSIDFNNNGELEVIGGAFTQLQANWNESDTQSVQYIQNKPTIPTVPTLKELVAGNNITLTESADDVTVACSVTIGTVVV